MSVLFLALAMVATCASTEQFEKRHLRRGSLLAGAGVALLIASWSS